MEQYIHLKAPTSQEIKTKNWGKCLAKNCT